jgi:hypothetical protein
MDQELLTLAGELPGLQAAQKVIADRIETIQRALRGGHMQGVVLQPSVKKAAAPISDAKKQALERARAALAKARKKRGAKKAG